MSNIAEMRILVDKLNEASKAYYNGKDEIMSNKESMFVKKHSMKALNKQSQEIE